MEDIINKQPLVTVGIICYNRTEGFKNTLKCITGQTYKNLEIIISQDFHDTIDFTEVATSAGDNRVTFVKQTKRLSMYNNFLFVLEKASGEYFMWAADDDWWAPDFIEKVMELLIANPSAALGFTDFMEVDEHNNRITTYPNHLPLLQEFAIADNVQRIKNYIGQFEAFGKPNLIYSIFRTKVLRSKQVIELLNFGELPVDMLINLTVLLSGKLVVVPELLRTATLTVVKGYRQEVYTPHIINLLIIRVNIGAFKYLLKKWNNYLYYHFKIVGQSDLNAFEKLAINLSILKKILLFYYDVVCDCISLRGYNIFAKIRRQYRLN